MKNIKLLVAAIALFAVASCQNSPTVQPKSEKADFSTSIGNYATRAADNHWDAGDEVGVYMIPAGSTLDASALALNKKYTTTGTNALAPASAADEIYYPDNGAAVDFIAYYPWQTTITDFVYPVNVATQNPLAKIDLLYSDNAKGYTKGDPTADMEFTHELSKIVLNIVDKTEEITMPSVTIEGINTTASFDLVTGALSGAGNPADVAMVVYSTGDHSAAAEAIIIPGAAADYTFVFKVGEKSLRLVIEDLVVEASKKYTYTVNVTDKVLMDGDGEIIDWDEQPGEDIEFDIKDMEDIPWDGDMSAIEVAVYPDPEGEAMALLPGLGFDPRFDDHTYWEGTHAVWDCEEDMDDILHLNFAEQLAAQFPKAENPSVLYELTWMLYADGSEASDVNRPVLSANNGDITIDRNNVDAAKDNAGTFIILRATFNAANVDVPIVHFYCIEIRDVPAVEPIPTGLLYFDGEGTLSLGVWGQELSAANYRDLMAYFRFGSVVGFITDGRNGDGFDPVRDIRFNPTGETPADYRAIPLFTPEDYDPGNIRDISGADYHNGANVLAGRGDPCRLVGFRSADFAGKNAAEVDEMLAANDAGYRLPTGQENAAFVEGPDNRWSSVESFFSPTVDDNGVDYAVTDKFSATVDNPLTARFLKGTYPDFVLPGSGYRNDATTPAGNVSSQGGVGGGNTFLWSSTPNRMNNNTGAFSIRYNRTDAAVGTASGHGAGFAVRCVRL